MTALSQNKIENSRYAKSAMSHEIARLKKDIAHLLSFKGCASMSRDYLAAAIKQRRGEIFEIQGKLRRYYGYESNKKN